MGIVREKVSAPAGTRRFYLGETFSGWSFILPGLVIVTTFTFVPLIATLLLSFRDVSSFNFPGRWIGVQNYVDLFTWDYSWWTALKNTLIIACVNIPVGMALGLLAAILVNQPLRGRTLFRWGFLIPVSGSAVAVSMMWILVFEPSRGGFLNYALTSLGITDRPIAWLGNEVTALPAVILTMFGNFGFRMLIYLSALQGIPRELYEAAKIDGAGSWATFRYVTWPMVMPATFFILVNNLASSLREGFEQVYVLTGGGPMGATEIVPLSIYRNAFVYNQIGYASGISVIVLLLTIVITLTIGRRASRAAQNAYLD